LIFLGALLKQRLVADARFLAVLFWNGRGKVNFGFISENSHY